MSNVTPRKGALTVALVAVLIFGIGSFIVIYSGIPLCIGCPTTTQYNAAGSTHTLKTIGSNGVVSSQTLTGGPSSWPIGSAYQGFTINGPINQFGSWYVTMPGDQSFGTGSSYVFQQSTSGTAFLSAANNQGLWNAESGSLGGQNPFVFNQTYTSSASAPSACNTASTVNVCKVTWYLNRYYFTLDMKTAGAGLFISCVPGTTCQGYSNFFGFTNKAQYDAAFQQGFQNVFSNVNSAAHLSSGSSLSLQLNLPPLPGGQSNLDFAGIVAAWTAPPCTTGSATPSGGGTGQGDLCVTNCIAPAGCSIVASTVHAPLPLFTDPQVTNKYLPACLTFLNVPSYTASQLAGACASSISGSVYTKIDISDFGAGYVQGSNYANCGISSYSSCWAAVQPEAVLTVLVDVLTSVHTFQTYPTPPPPTGTSAGGFDGQVVDGSIPVYKPGVPGASVCLTDIAGCTTVNSAGYFNMTNVSAGQHTVQVTAPGFTASAQISISVSNGQTFHMGQISLAPLNPWYSGNLCIQGTQGFFGLSAGICIPYILLFTLVGAGVLALAVIAFVYSRPADTAARLAERLTPKNPLTPDARGFVARRIAQEIRAGVPAKQAQAIAFSEARQRGFHVPPPPKTKSK